MPVHGQEPVPQITSDKLDFRMEFPNGPELEISNFEDQGTLFLQVTDQSKDSVPDGTGQQHEISLEVTTLTDDEGWRVRVPISSYTIFPGETQTFQIRVTPTSFIQEFDLLLNLNVTMTTFYCCGTFSQDAVALVKSPGSPNAFVQAKSSTNPLAGPDEIITLEMDVTNKGLVDRTYTVVPTNNKCNLFISDATFIVPGLETKSITVQLVTPSDKWFYLQETCLVSLVVEDTATGRQSNSVPVQVKIQGAYVDPGWIINTGIVLAIVGAIVWLILLAKRRAEEEVLGKPQPPWTLPAEQVYLAELQKKDPQAAYVVRHFLMEDEYASSLLWYKSYKNATKGRRKAERKALKIEHAFEKWDLRMQAQLANTADTDKQVDKLQAKLDRKTRKAHKKEHKKWKKQVSKLEAKAANDHNKAMNDYRKAAKKAAKKGEAAPKQPSMAQPDLPPEPQMDSVDVDEHPRFAKKKQRILDRASKSEERAEANYQRLHAKKMEATQRKLAKLAEDIDDPAFVNEHPMLKDAIASSA